MITIIPTIDVEGVHGDQPFEQLILGKTASGNSGTLKMAELFNQYGAKGTFFIDVYEYIFWGKDKFEKLCHDLMELGQDIQLHTHPSWRDDPRDSNKIRALKKKINYFPQELDFMAKLDLNQQIEVLEHGKELLKKWTGEYPIAHRSGGYSINQNTVDALRKVNIPVDSSMHYGHINSKLTWTKNQIIEREGIIELPVTVFEVKLLHKSIFKKIMKTDLDSCSFEEFKWYIEDCRSKDLKLVNFFLHSFSLLDMHVKFKKIESSHHKIKRMEKTLEFFSKASDCQIISVAEFYKQYKQDKAKFIGSDEIPIINAPKKILSLGAKKIKRRLVDQVA